MKYVLLTVCSVSTLALAAEPMNWPRFRGPNGSGVVPAARTPVEWTEDDFDWKVTLPAAGASGPVVWGERIFVTSGDKKTGKRFVTCVQVRDGKILWNHELAGEPYKMHAKNTVASSTPAVDAERVYTCWATPQRGQVVAFDHEGQKVWSHELGGYPSQHGFAVSPVLVGGLLIVHHQPDGPGVVIALDARTGEERWTLDRQGKNATYSTPVLFEAAGRPAELILTNWQHGITGVDPNSGKVNWEVSVFEPNKQERAIASPVVAGNLVIGQCGFVTAQKHLVAVRPAGPGTGEPAKEVWRLEKSVPQMASPLVIDDRVFLLTETGLALCLKRDTGEKIWEERIPGQYYASPIAVGDRIYCPATDGQVLVLRAADEFEQLARNPLGEPTEATPAVVADRLIFRTDTHLISVGGKQSQQK